MAIALVDFLNPELPNPETYNSYEKPL